MNSGEVGTSPGDITTKCGYLTRPVKNGKSVGFRRRRFYKLDGAVLSKHAHKGSPASVVKNIQGAEIKEIGRAMFAITLQEAEGTETQKQRKEVLVLSARTEKECAEWIWALQAAAERRVEQYYDVGRVIGEGGFAVVRIGRCLRTKELRAIKTLKKDDTYAKLQGREIAIIKNTDHPNIVKTYDVFETYKEIHIVMEYMAGGMLYDAIEDGIRFAEADVIQFIREILDAILYLHGKGIVHRDLKPENILCTSRTMPLHVKIADFGLSCINSVADLRANKVLMSTMIGTPEFIAPEIARQEPYTEKVDMWALGMLCYNVIAGSLPIDETNDVIPQIKDGVKLSFPERVWNSYSLEARSFLRALLCTQPQRRLSPLGCMVHPWLERDSGRASTKIGAHGRVSQRISRMNLKREQWNDGKHMEAAEASNNRNRRKEKPGKTRWKMAYLAIAAANRFRFLVSPWEPRKLVEFSSNDSFTLEGNLGELESDSDESTVGSAKLAFFLKAVRSSGEKLNRKSLPSPKEKKKSFGAIAKSRQSSDRISKTSGSLDDREDKTGSGPRSLTSKNTWRDRGKSESYREGVFTSKMTARSKPEASSGMSPLRKASRKLSKVGSTGLLGPLRKLSRKITGGAKNKGENVGDEDLEQSLAALGVQDVDESDLLKLEDADCSNVTSVSKFSKLGES